MPFIETICSVDSCNDRTGQVRHAVVGLLVVLSSCIVPGCSVLPRYRVDDCMEVEVKEYTPCEYPDDPARHSSHYGRYDGRTLQLVDRGDGRHFDFILEPHCCRTARIVFRNVDVSLMTPALPCHVRGDKGLERIALVDRQWNRQQVHFDVPGPHVEVTGGDGVESSRITGASLAKNCLNAGLWEVLLSVEECGEKKLYYHGWFTFPLGQYKELWEANTDRSYWRDDCFWYRMEHWLDPSGTRMNLARLRSVCSAVPVDVHYDPCEPIVCAGDQVKKLKTTRIPHPRTWGALTRYQTATFATFRKPGVYDWEKPWNNEFWRIACLQGGIVRRVKSPQQPCRVLHEIELVYRPDTPARTMRSGCPKCRRYPDCTAKAGCEKTRIIIGGIDLNEVPVLPMTRYSKGLYMPMGISVPPFHQTYRELQNEPPQCSPYYSFIVDEDDRWIDHHDTAIDGPVIHRDEHNPDLIHVYLLSYERHSLVAHYVLAIPRDTTLPAPVPETLVPPAPE